MDPLKMSVDITSPPFPSMTVRSMRMYQHFQELWEWTRNYREVINSAADHQVIPPLHEVPQRTVYEALPDTYKASNVFAMRRIREAWDALVRDHEDSWDSTLAYRRRLEIVSLSVGFLNTAFLDPEKREANAETAAANGGLRVLMQTLLGNSAFLDLTRPPDGMPPGGG